MRQRAKGFDHFFGIDHVGHGATHILMIIEIGRAQTDVNDISRNIDMSYHASAGVSAFGAFVLKPACQQSLTFRNGALRVIPVIDDMFLWELVTAFEVAQG